LARVNLLWYRGRQDASGRGVWSNSEGSNDAQLNVKQTFSIQLTPAKLSSQCFYPSIPSQMSSRRFLQGVSEQVMPRFSYALYFRGHRPETPTLTDLATLVGRAMLM
jgi:hypothetical protein